MIKLLTMFSRMIWCVISLLLPDSYLSHSSNIQGKKSSHQEGDGGAKQTRTPVAVTVVVGSLESMYVYAFIQYLNGHSHRLSGLDT
jgi:hypothetical protein